MSDRKNYPFTRKNKREPDENAERRRYERRTGIERRGSLRWDPKADERRRRSEIERRRLTLH